MISENLIQKREEMKKLAKKTRNEAYYQKNKENRKECDVCCCLVSANYWEKHLETKRHNAWAEIKKKSQPEPEPEPEVIPEILTKKTKKIKK
jgi:hypothetical protein